MPAGPFKTASGRDEATIGAGGGSTLEFDDVVFRLQRFGGISEYWREMTSRVAAMPEFSVVRSTGSRWGRMRTLHSACGVFHSSYYRTARGRRVRNVTTVHDLAYELGFAGTGLRSHLHRLMHRRAFFASDALICISERTRADLLQVYPSLAGRCAIFVIPHGVSLSTTLASGDGQAKDIAAEPYILFVGRRGDYKNFALALEAFSASTLPRHGFRLLCTGSAFSAAEQRRISRMNLDNKVLAIEVVSRGLLAQLYSAAYCLLYPSLFEGFGMPLLEAMKLGCPVVASKGSVIPEVAGDAALLVDARDPMAMADALTSLADPSLRKRLVDRGRQRAALFTWERSAAQHASVYRSLSDST